MPLKKTLDEEVIFEQAAPATPAQFAQGSLPQRLIRIQAVQVRVAQVSHVVVWRWREAPIRCLTPRG